MVNPIDVPAHILLAGGGIPYYIQQYPQGIFLQVPWCHTLPGQVWTEESNSANKNLQIQDVLSLILKSM